jgi:hypothetical protein
MVHEGDKKDFDELLSGALRTYGTAAPEGIAVRVLKRVDAAQHRRRFTWRRFGLPLAVLSAAAALALAAWLHVPRAAPPVPSFASKLPEPEPETVLEPAALPESALLYLPLRSVRHALGRRQAAASDNRSRPFPVIPAPIEEQQLTLVLIHHKEELKAEQPDKPASITPIEIKPIEIQPIQIADISK